MRPVVTPGCFAGAAWLALVLAACGIVASYPEPLPEDTLARCSDGTDNDFDGRADCADPRCSEFCPEADEATCDDGVDNDLDGRTDCADFGCVEPCTAMARMPDGAWIDATEVTRGAYEAWLATHPSPAGQPVSCEGNQDFASHAACALPACESAECRNRPQACVDWCDAHAYCRAAGKELCGKPEGGGSPFQEFTNETISQWFDACSSGGTQPFVYGVEHTSAMCQDASAGFTEAPGVRTAPHCDSVVSAYSGVYDLLGNVGEWESSCVDDAGGSAPCRVRGGGFRSETPDCSRDESLPRDQARDDVGFRCCKPIPNEPETSRKLCGDGLDNDRNGRVDCADEGCTEPCCGSKGLPLMVAMPQGYCIDATEVTRKQYAAWLKTNPPFNGQVPACAYKEQPPYYGDRYTPPGEWPPGFRGAYPVVWVDWCDAHAYCSAMGKRLCGKIGGGPIEFYSFASATTSEWVSACSSGGALAYPYGNTFDPEACNGSQKVNEAFGCSGCMPMPVASLPACQSPVDGYGGVFDLSGNVEEWDDSCTVYGEAGARCRARGGATSFADRLACVIDPTKDDYYAERNYPSRVRGFRCCATWP